MPPRAKRSALRRLKKINAQYMYKAQSRYRSMILRKRLQLGGVHSFTRNTRQTYLDLTTPALNWVPESYTFQLTDIINVADFENLFDQFKIEKVELIMRWSPTASVYTSSNTNQGQGVYNPVLYYVRDYDDNDLINNITDMQEIQKHRSVRLTPHRPIKINLKPAVLAQAYKTAVTTSYGPKWGMKLSMNDDSTPHYGLKVGVQKLGENMGQISIDTKYHFTCYGVQ